MATSKKTRTNFAGTYFDRDSVPQLARLADIFAWATLVYYVAQCLLSLLVFSLQVGRGLIQPGGLTDIAQQVFWFFQPALPGMAYFVGLQAVGKALLIFMDVEENTRRAARK